MKLIQLFSLLALYVCHTAVTLANTQFNWPPQNSNVIGELRSTFVRDGETLLDIAERFGLGYADIRDANPQLDPWIPQVGARVSLPTQYILPAAPYEGIVINLAEYRLYYFLPEQGIIHSFPIGIGRSQSPTPQGDMTITARIPNPTWYPPASIRNNWAAQGREVKRVIPPGPENPLGPYAINLSAEGYLIHGTNQRFGIGTQASAGCIRMNNHDIEALFNMTRIGVPVRIIDQPVKIGWLNNHLMLEAHHPVRDSIPAADIHAQIIQQRDNAPRPVEILWNDINQVLSAQTGTPVTIGF